MPTSPNLLAQVETVLAQVSLFKMEITQIQVNLRKIKTAVEREQRHRDTIASKRVVRRHKKNETDGNDCKIGFAAIVVLSDALAAFFDGQVHMSRIEVAQRIWSYAKLNKLVTRDANNHLVMHHLNAALDALFTPTTNPITYASLQNLLRHHFTSHPQPLVQPLSQPLGASNNAKINEV